MAAEKQFLRCLVGWHGHVLALGSAGQATIDGIGELVSRDHLG
jgi:hypothetical protein